MFSDVEQTHSKSLQKYVESHNGNRTVPAGFEGAQSQPRGTDTHKSEFQAEGSGIGSNGSSSNSQMSKGPSGDISPSGYDSTSSSIFDPAPGPDPKYLALCLRMGRSYQTLEELVVTTQMSDGHLFSTINEKLKEYKAATPYRRLSSLLSEINGVAFIKVRFRLHSSKIYSCH